VVQTAARLCRAEIAGIAIRSGDLYRYVATFSLDREWDQMLRTMTFALERQPVYVADVAADPEFAVPGAVTLGGMRTSVAAAG